jgi:nitrogen fixation protein FixH
MTQATARPLTGRFVALCFLGFFGTVFAANMTMVYFATHSWTGLVVRNSYVASQTFDKDTARMTADAAVAHVSLAYANGSLNIQLKDAEGQPLPAQKITLHVGRPSHERDDKTLDLTPTSAGQFDAPLQLGAGQWRGDVVLHLGNGKTVQRPVLLTVKG